MMKAVEIVHYCIIQSARLKNVIIIAHYIIKPPCVHFDMAYLQHYLPGIENCNSGQ